MIPHKEALDIVLNSVSSTMSTEKIDFTKSLNRILAQDIFSDMNMPPFDKSAMDGYACRMSDIHNELNVIEILPAGKVPENTIAANQCIKIMTGAIIPEGADCVLMIEFTEETKPGFIKFTKKSTKSNICYLGEDIKTDEQVLKKGVKIAPQHIAVMASVGCIFPEVYAQPKIGIISTGSEIVEPNIIPGKSQIRNSNGYQLIAQVVRAGCIPDYVGIAEDTHKATYDAIKRALDKNDIILITGGVSMGDFDMVPDIMKEIGIEIKFNKIAVQPGKPTTFGIFGDNKYVFGLPGNPVSSYTQFELLTRPLINKLMGSDDVIKIFKLPMGASYKRRKSERKSFIPIIIKEDGKVYPIEYHGSAHIHSYVFANGITSVEIGKEELEIGEMVDVRQV